MRIYLLTSLRNCLRTGRAKLLDRRGELLGERTLGEVVGCAERTSDSIRVAAPVRGHGGPGDAGEQRAADLGVVDALGDPAQRRSDERRSESRERRLLELLAHQTEHALGDALACLEHD